MATVKLTYCSQCVREFNRRNDVAAILPTTLAQMQAVLCENHNQTRNRLCPSCDSDDTFHNDDGHLICDNCGFDESEE